MNLAETRTDTVASPASSTAPPAPAAQPSALPAAELDARHRFLNRETSWLAFNRRVFEEALSPHNPLLERLNFLAITDNNLDEFFMKRVGGLQRQLGAGVKQLSQDGKTPAEQLDEVRALILQVVAQMSDLYEKTLLPELREQGVLIAAWSDLTHAQRERLREHFEKSILPILTPLGVGPGQPFPFISNLSLSLAVLVRAPGDHLERFARVKIPVNRPRWIRVPGETVFIALEDLIAHHIDRLFVGMEILEVTPFRVTRNADVERNEEEAEDLLDVIEEELRNRRFAPVVRLETRKDISENLLGRLVHELGVDAARDLYQTAAPLGQNDLFELTRLDMPHLRFPPFAPVSHPRLRELGSSQTEANIFDIIRRGDVLVHHPFQSFSTSVLELLRAAAHDPQVLAIKQTLYRTAEQSKVVAILLEAAGNGKEVNVQIEIKARFDEANNIEWVRTLEKAGVHVTYGFVGLKTHCKTLLVVRDEPEGIRRYVHIGTGNYHPDTARLYTDLGLFTCNPELCQDVADLFNYLTGHSNFKAYRKLLVAPVNMRARFMEMIRREVDRHAAGQPGYIWAKMNALEDTDIINALYAASQAGVKIDLIVRGFCCLRPGVPGLSENIRVVSIVGRFLEHSRIYYFRNGGQGEYYIGSADWMSRNLDWRVECITPITNPELQKELEFILRTCWADHRQLWELHSDGTYQRRRPMRGKGSQNLLIDRAVRQAIKA